MGSQELLFGHHIVHHNLVDLDLLVNPAYHHLLIYRLIRSSDIVAVKIDIHIIHLFHKGKRLENKQVVYIKSMLRQLQTAVF